MASLREAVEHMFPGENVSPTFETYNDMVVYWRGSQPAPSQAAINAVAAQMDAEAAKVKYIEEQSVAIRDEVTTDEMVRALWDKINGDETAFKAIDPIIQKAKADFPKPA